MAVIGVLATTDAVCASTIYGEARANYLAASVGQSTADFNDGSGLADTYGTGRWNYYASTAIDPSSGTLTRLSFGTANYAVSSGYLGTGLYGLPIITDSLIYTGTTAPTASELAIHPGDPGASGVIRWTAGAGEAATDIHGTITRSDSSTESDGAAFKVYVGGVETYSLALAAGDLTTHSFDLTGQSIAVGQNVDFVLDCGGTAWNDAANFSATISYEAPEPSTCVLCVIGLIGLLCYAWRKRN